MSPLPHARMRRWRKIKAARNRSQPSKPVSRSWRRWSSELEGGDLTPGALAGTVRARHGAQRYLPQAARRGRNPRRDADPQRGQDDRRTVPPGESEKHEPARIPRPATASWWMRNSTAWCPPETTASGNHSPRHALQPVRRRQAHPSDPLHGGGAHRRRRRRGRRDRRLRAGTDPHLFADPRRPAGARQRRLPPRQAHLPQSVRRRHGDSGGRRAADAGLSGARRNSTRRTAARRAWSRSSPRPPARWAA